MIIDGVEVLLGIDLAGMDHHTNNNYIAIRPSGFDYEISGPGKLFERLFFANFRGIVGEIIYNEYIKNNKIHITMIISLDIANKYILSKYCDDNPGIMERFIKKIVNEVKEEIKL